MSSAIELPRRDLTRYDLAQVLLNLDGKPLSLTDYPFTKELYACRTSEMLLMAGRQIGKSTTLRNMLLLDACLIDYFDALYVVPLKEQAQRFSNNYLGRGINESPVLRKWRFDTSCVDNIFSKSFTNGSVIQLTYAGESADRARGISNDEILYDEVQDILWDVIPIINESVSASPHKWKIYSGTPKTMDNPMETLWERSSQHMWAMRCPSCKKFNTPDLDTVYKMLQPRGLSCVHCQSFLNVRDGFWQPRRPSASDDFLGFHLPQIIVPKNVEYNPKDPEDRPPKPPKAWRELMKKYKYYPPGVFANEVLGFSYDLGGRLITENELAACCVLPSFKQLTPGSHHGCSHICMGVDWGISAEQSFTVAVVGGFDAEGRTKVFEVRKYYGTDTVEQTKDIAKLAVKWNVEFIGADFGVGYTNNLLLKQMLGVNKVVEFQYATCSTLMNWNGVRFILDRTTSLNLMFIDLKRCHVLFPPFEEMDVYLKDLLAIYEHIVEGTGQNRKVFRRTPNIPDDFAHALNFLTMTLRRAAGDPIVNMKTGENLYDEAFRSKEI